MSVGQSFENGWCEYEQSWWTKEGSLETPAGSWMVIHCRSWKAACCGVHARGRFELRSPPCLWPVSGLLFPNLSGGFTVGSHCGSLPAGDICACCTTAKEARLGTIRFSNRGAVDDTGSRNMAHFLGCSAKSRWHFQEPTMHTYPDFYAHPNLHLCSNSYAGEYTHATSAYAISYSNSRTSPDDH
jgi:hypothetical protein